MIVKLITLPEDPSFPYTCHRNINTTSASVIPVIQLHRPLWRFYALHSAAFLHLTLSTFIRSASAHLISDPTLFPTTHHNKPARMPSHFAYRRSILKYASQSDTLSTAIHKLNKEITTLTETCQNQPESGPRLKLYSELLDKCCSYIIASQQLATLTRQILCPHTRDRIWSECINPCLVYLRECAHPPSDSGKFLEEAASTLEKLVEKAPESHLAWTKYLGDLYARGDFLRKHCVDLAKYWYLTACYIAPEDGEIYHCLAKVSTNVLQKHLLRSQALCAVDSFPRARDSLVKLFERYRQGLFLHDSPLMSKYFEAHGLLLANKNIEASQCTQEFLGFFSNEDTEPPQSSIEEFIGLLNGQFKPDRNVGGLYIAITSIAAMFGFGSEESPLVQSLKKQAYIAGTPESPPYTSFLLAESFTNELFKMFLRQIRACQDDPSLLSFVHCMLVFINFMSQNPPMRHLESNIPWVQLVQTLNSLLLTQSHLNHKDISFPQEHHLLKEDLAIRGLLFAWGQDYYIDSWFRTRLAEDTHDDASLMHERKYRIILLGIWIARPGKWIRYSEQERLFFTVKSP